jgi:hypothetical protein
VWEFDRELEKYIQKQMDFEVVMREPWYDRANRWARTHYTEHLGAFAKDDLMPPAAAPVEAGYFGGSRCSKLVAEGFIIWYCDDDDPVQPEIVVPGEMISASVNAVYHAILNGHIWPWIVRQGNRSYTIDGVRGLSSVLADLVGSKLLTESLKSQFATVARDAARGCWETRSAALAYTLAVGLYDAARGNSPSPHGPTVVSDERCVRKFLEGNTRKGVVDKIKDRIGTTAHSGIKLSEAPSANEFRHSIMAIGKLAKKHYME